MKQDSYLQTQKFLPEAVEWIPWVFPLRSQIQAETVVNPKLE